MTSRKRGILVIEDEELDLSMTLIIGHKTKEGLLIATDGLARVTMGLEEKPAPTLTNQPKVYQVSPNIVIGISGGMVNHLNQFINDVSRSVENKGVTSLTSLAKGIEDYIPKLYADRINHPSFGITLFMAGYVEDEKGADKGKLMFMLHEGKIYTYDEAKPYLCVGNNGKAYQYLEDNPPKDSSERQVITALKNAIADTAETEDDVGGHTFVYRITGDAVTRLE